MNVAVRSGAESDEQEDGGGTLRCAICLGSPENPVKLPCTVIAFTIILPSTFALGPRVKLSPSISPDALPSMRSSPLKSIFPFITVSEEITELEFV